MRLFRIMTGLRLKKLIRGFLKMINNGQPVANMKDKQLATNFWLSEFLCHCGCGTGDGIVRRTLIDGLQKLRDLVGVPIRVDSGCRCEKHNAAIGGASHSKHLQGIAADISFPTMFSGKIVNVTDMYLLAEEIPDFRNGGIGINLNKHSIHVDVRNDGRARWVKMVNANNSISIVEWILSAGTERK